MVEYIWLFQRTQATCNFKSRGSDTLSGFRRPINRAYVTMVAIDEHEKPKEVAFGLELETETEKIEWESGKKRAELRKQRRREGF